MLLAALQEEPNSNLGDIVHSLDVLAAGIAAHVYSQGHGSYIRMLFG
jgi:hypothetical protein